MGYSIALYGALGQAYLSCKSALPLLCFVRAGVQLNTCILGSLPQTTLRAAGCYNIIITLIAKEKIGVADTPILFYQNKSGTSTSCTCFAFALPLLFAGL